jgi:hypothetical protein
MRCGLRCGLRRTLGTVSLHRVTDNGPPYLKAVFEGGDMPLVSR